MSTLARNRWWALALAACALNAQATGLEALEHFVRNVSSARCEFTQSVTLPAREGQAARVKISSGTFAFARPGRFRFDYRKPFEQTIVADGQTLWLYDQDLNQVSARKQASVLGSTPAALVASAPNLDALRAEFTLVDDGAQDGLEWVRATPKGKDSALQSVRVGLRGGSLERLEIIDSFAQKSLLRFSNLQANGALDAALFQFKPPAGADLIRQ
ncbi:MAG: outer membrane lipoprotein chaperone LolA [Rhodoferax sp.]